MKLSQNFSITEESFPEQSSWISNLLSPLSSVINEQLLALRANLTIGDNLIGVVTKQTINTLPTYSTGGFTPVRIFWSPGSKNLPDTVLVGRVEVPSNQASPTTAVTATNWSYDFASQSIIINHITGLANSSTYTITFECK